MAPKGSRASLYIFISTIAALVLLLLTFHPQLISAVQSLGLTKPAPLLRKYSWNAASLPYGAFVFREWPLIGDLSPSADKAWEQTLLTSNGGFLYVGDDKAVDREWGISMFHALHCLKMLRIVIRTSEMMNVTGDPGSFETPAGLHMSPEHIGHCIGYIAQYILCAADGTIEPPEVWRNDHGEIIKAEVNGHGYQHQCRDARSLWKASTKSAKADIEAWGWKSGDTIESVFGKGKR
ncbi:MAG: hypothetical protein Q9214_000453 [Letrouitia sp. 1 TL-2023]